MSNSHLLGNSAWNAGAFLVNVGLNFFILPFALLQMGASVFGVAGLVTACIAPALAFSNALALSTTRELAQRLLPDQRDDARQDDGVGAENIEKYFPRHAPGAPGRQIERRQRQPLRICARGEAVNQPAID